MGKKNWYHLDPPRHIYHYTANSSTLFFKKNDLNVKKIYYNSFFQNFLGDIITLNNLVLPHKNILLNVLRFNSYYFKKTNPIARIFNLLFFTVFTAILFFPFLIFTHISQLVKKSGNIVVLLENA